MADGKRAEPFRENDPGDAASGQTVDLLVRVPEDLYRAYHRCCWIVHHETGRERNDLAKEMVTDFLIKNGC